jgi:transcription elongation factor GreB
LNKAFTKEDTDDDADDDPRDDAPAKPRGSEHITREGYRALQDELSRLWKVDRPKITDEVSTAAAQGDRSENAEYIYGKKKLREIDRRIRFLTKRLDAVTVVEPSSEQKGRVFFGAWITIEDEDGKESTYRIVGTDELDLAARKISVKSPVAQALLGKSEGDTVLVQRPKGPTEVTIIKVWYGAETDS